MSISDPTPEELNELACEVFGIKPCGWYARAGTDRYIYPTRQSSDDVEVFPRVSEEPAACAMQLKAAMSEVGLPMLLIFYGEDVLAMLCDAVGEHPEEDAHELSATAEIWARAKTEERAVALAVVAWARAMKERAKGEKD